MTPAQIYQAVSVLVLAFLLLLPVSKIIWVLSVRRLQGKLDQKLNENEIQAQLRRARFIGFFVALIFSVLFHLSVLRDFYG